MTAAGAAFLGLVSAGIAVALVPWLIARAGWGKLAAAYVWDGPRPKPCTSFGYGVLNRWIGYKHCLVVAVDEQALYLWLWKPFSLFHPPLRVPWARLTRVEDYRVLWMRWPQVGFADVPDVKLSLKPKTFACLGGRLG